MKTQHVSACVTAMVLLAVSAFAFSATELAPANQTAVADVELESLSAVAVVAPDGVDIDLNDWQATNSPLELILQSISNLIAERPFLFFWFLLNRSPFGG